MPELSFQHRRRMRAFGLAGGGAAAVAALLLAALIALTAGPRPSLAQASAPLLRAPDGRALAMTFEADFRRPQDAPGRSRLWRTTYGDGHDNGPSQRNISSNHELQVYIDPDYAAELNPLAVRDGVLEITARPTPEIQAAKLWGFRYISGLITTQPSFAQRYGYFEISARLPQGKGLWPALWMLPADMTWPPEIDIMESIGDPLTAYMSVHGKAASPYTKQVTLADRGFHTYAVSWDARELVWYVDGAEVSRQPTPPDMDKPMYLLANLAVGGIWPGAPDEATRFPATFAIRYIRAYKFA
ncbi:MAG: glycoside hydrolase family 16 protein [Caulobacteraceae bacterium]|nr:glycoside hydrolase family 16 protein [Caulobacteraceae bacterium]